MRKRLPRARTAALVLAGVSGAIAGLLALRFLFLLLIANPANPVVAAVLAGSRPYLFPWSKVWPPAELPGMAVEKATLVALAGYLFLGLLLAFLAAAVWGRESPRPEDESR